MSDSRKEFEAAIQQATKMGMDAGLEAANKAWEEQLPKLFENVAAAARRAALEEAAKVCDQRSIEAWGHSSRECEASECADDIRALAAQTGQEGKPCS